MVLTSLVRRPMNDQVLPTAAPVSPSERCVSDFQVYRRFWHCYRKKSVLDARDEPEENRLKKRKKDKMILLTGRKRKESSMELKHIPYK